MALRNSIRNAILYIMIEKFVFLLLVACLALSCSSHRSVAPPVSHKNPYKRTLPKKPKSSKIKKSVEDKKVTDNKKVSQTFWELVSPEEITLIIKGLDTGNEVLIPLSSSNPTTHSIGGGSWQVVGFNLGADEFRAMNTSQKFIFRVKKKSWNYAGTIIAQCPKVAPEHQGALKVMRFFNRYPFSSQTGLCELVIGDDFANVELEFKKDPETKDFPLNLGF